MTLACAFFEEIPMYAINNKPRWVVNDRTALGLLKQIINDFEYVDSTQYSCIHMNYVKAILLKLRPIFWDLSIHWRTPEVLITVNNGEKHSLVQVLNSAFNELNERLVELEKIVQPGKKTDFQKLQGWVHSKRHFH